MKNIYVAVVGFRGRMGRLVREEVERRNGMLISQLIERTDWRYDSLTETDVAIVFVSPDAGYEVTNRILEAGVDAVVGTTRFYLNPDGTENHDMLFEFDDLAKKNKCRMIYASNFSLGMNAFWKILRMHSKMLFQIGYDVAVEERHHNKKADISGTAKTIGEILLRASQGVKTRLIFGDCERKRRDNEITISSTRVGDIPGTHTVIFDSKIDTIELTHRIRDPKIFAKGAVDAAFWLRDKEPGLYTIRDMI